MQKEFYLCTNGKQLIAFRDKLKAFDFYSKHLRNEFEGFVPSINNLKIKEFQSVWKIIVGYSKSDLIWVQSTVEKNFQTFEFFDDFPKGCENWFYFSNYFIDCVPENDQKLFRCLHQLQIY